MNKDILSFNYKKPIKVIDRRKTLVGIGFIDKEQTNINAIPKKFQLPSLDLLEKNLTKLSPKDLNNNRPDAKFMEGILKDFGI